MGKVKNLELTYKELLYLKESIEFDIADEERHISTYEKIIEIKKDQPEQVESGEKLIIFSKNKIAALNNILNQINA